MRLIDYVREGIESKANAGVERWEDHALLFFSDRAGCRREAFMLDDTALRELVRQASNVLAEIEG